MTLSVATPDVHNYRGFTETFSLLAWSGDKQQKQSRLPMHAIVMLGSGGFQRSRDLFLRRNSPHLERYPAPIPAFDAGIAQLAVHPIRVSSCSAAHMQQLAARPNREPFRYSDQRLKGCELHIIN